MKKFAIIGNPIQHSLSPIMHQWIFNTLNIKAQYIKINISESEISQICNNLNNGSLNGINITIPFKEKMIAYIDEVNPRAQEIGSVNCILSSNCRLIGNNTDWYGFSMILKKNNISLQNRQIIVLGAGGSSKAILYALKQNGAKKILLFNRSNSRFKKIGVYSTWRSFFSCIFCRCCSFNAEFRSNNKKYSC